MYSSPTRNRIERDWLGRRVDLKEFHRDPTCLTHADPYEPCTCHALFREWMWIVDWTMCIGIVASILLLTWMVATLLSPA
jgi:hypothetical protein